MVIMLSFLLGLLGFVMAQEPQSETRRGSWELVLVQAAVIGPVEALVWVLECTDGRRATDYVWKD